MKQSPLVELAESVARKAHAHQVDKQGEPYIEHCRRVAESLVDPIEQSVGWLHDTLEDTDIGAEGLLAFPLLVRQGVIALTRARNETYEDYIERISQSDDFLIRVKLADLRDNMRGGDRFPTLKARYLKAIERLERVDPLMSQDPTTDQRGNSR